MAQNWGQTEMDWRCKTWNSALSTTHLHCDFGMFLNLYLFYLQSRKKSVAVLTTLLEEPKEALNFFFLFLETTDISNFSSYVYIWVNLWKFGSILLSLCIFLCKCLAIFIIIINSFNVHRWFVWKLKGEKICRCPALKFSHILQDKALQKN